MRQAVWTALLMLALPVSADEVFLKSGGRISGIVVEQSATRIVLQTGPGTVALPRTSVDHVVQQQSALQTFDERAAHLHPSDREGLLDLALWARDQGLETRARETFLRVLSIDPGNALALAGVGRVWMNNRWLTEEEAHMARGDVRFEGSWMSREEREDRIREESERRADDRARRESDARVAEAEARTREAEAAARRAEADSSNGGIPYGWVAGGGGYLGGGYLNGRGALRPPHAAPGHRTSPVPPAAMTLPASRDTGRTSGTEAPPRRN